ncbi:MAG: hypothetical protein K6C05_00545 [Anaerovibrio sp.]|uniref:hypothetical protein n=1 Tax=Anaerovibrio sp. TaxID=1872532 RepID=UPI0025F91684|nr:hypothetical protein [Anaerovibrio sp.]MCR5175316.1 hypothetical protein [Anaerovibrio sp.]
MDIILPIILFAFLVIVGNVLDKKKPTAKPIPPDWIPPDVKGSKEYNPTDIDGSEEASEQSVAYYGGPERKTNPYQEYLSRHGVPERHHGGQVTDSAYSNDSGKQVQPMNGMVQAVIWAEILGAPRARRNRIR